jgi:pyridoxine/pyridoxamine 5'-phosphate oxidase
VRPTGVVPMMRPRWRLKCSTHVSLRGWNNRVSCQESRGYFTVRDLRNALLAWRCSRSSMRR